MYVPAGKSGRCAGNMHGLCSAVLAICSHPEREKREPRPSGVVLSYAVYGSQRAISAVLANVLKVTDDAMLIVHVASGSSGAPGWITNSSRVIMNPTQLQIGKNNPLVLGAHLSNFKLCEAVGPCAGRSADGVRFVLMPTNGVLFRSGLEQWVLDHSMSFCTSYCTTFHVGDAAPRNNSLPGWQGSLEQLAWSAEHPSPVSVSIRDALRTGDDANGAGWWTEPLVKLLRSGAVANGNRMWAPMPANAHTHEGAFYPVHLMRAFVHCALPATPFDAPLVTDGADFEACKQMYRSANLTAEAESPLGGCQFDEFLLPTFARQHYAHLVPTSSPPLILVMWICANCAGAGASNATANTDLQKLYRHMRHHCAAYGHVFGFKAAKHQYITTQNAIIGPLLRGVGAWPSCSNSSLLAAPAARPHGE